MHDDASFDRRHFVKVGALALAALAIGVPSGAQAEVGPDDELSDEVKKVLSERFGVRRIRQGYVQLDVPEVAPDSREVPIFVDVDLPMTPDDYVKAIHIIVDHNPDIYLAGFGLTPASGAASIDTRIKMRRSSHVRAIAETSKGDLWMMSRMVYTSLNGCV